jgi:hypothetical protein
MKKKNFTLNEESSKSSDKQSNNSPVDLNCGLKNEEGKKKKETQGKDHRRDTPPLNERSKQEKSGCKSSSKERKKENRHNEQHKKSSSHATSRRLPSEELKVIQECNLYPENQVLLY